MSADLWDWAAKLNALADEAEAAGLDDLASTLRSEALALQMRLDDEERDEEAQAQPRAAGERMSGDDLA